MRLDYEHAIFTFALVFLKGLFTKTRGILRFFNFLQKKDKIQSFGSKTLIICPHNGKCQM